MAWDSSMPLTSKETLSLEEAIETAMEQRQEVVQAPKHIESSELNKQYARNQLLPTLSLARNNGGFRVRK